MAVQKQVQAKQQQQHQILKFTHTKLDCPVAGPTAMKLTMDLCCWIQSPPDFDKEKRTSYL
jgi:hypothetical protein